MKFLILVLFCSASFVLGRKLRTVPLTINHKAVTLEKMISQTPQVKPEHFGLQNAISFPVNATYAIVEYYHSGNCGSNYYMGFSYLLNTCIASNETSVMYSCDSNGLSIQDYSDAVCGAALGSPGVVPSQCYPVDSDSFQVTACGTSDPLAFSKSSVVGVNYQTAGCTDDVVYAMAWKNNYCLSFAGTEDDSDGSMLVQWPYQKFYETSTKCKGNPSFSMDITVFGCQANDDPVDNLNPTQAGTFSDYVYVESSSAALPRFSVFSLVSMLALVFFTNQFM